MMTTKKPKRTKTTKLWLEVEYSPKRTDPESLATAVDRLLETILSTPGIMEEYGDPTFGPCWVAGPGDPIRRCNSVKSDGVFHLVLSSELSREALEAIVAKVQGLLYLDMDRAGREFWNPAKEWGGADVCQDIQDVLHQHGLVPGEEQDCMPTTTESPPASAAELVAWAQSQGLGPEDLDDEIHDHVAVAASNLNNRGLSAQIEFLVGQFGAAETRKLLTEVIPDNASRGATA
jgi:hypothetical protein